MPILAAIAGQSGALEGQVVQILRDLGHLQYKTTVYCYCTHDTAATSSTGKALMKY